MSYKLTIEDSFYNYKPISTQLIKYKNTKYHSHEFIEFYYVIDGKAVHYINGKRSIIERGCSFLLLPDDSHSFENADNAFLHRDIMIKIDFFKSICDQYSSHLFKKIMKREYPLSIIIDSASEVILEKLATTFEMKANESTDLLEKQICFEIIGLFIFYDNSTNNNVVARLIKVLSSPNNFKYDINDLLSFEDYGYCREYLCRLFKKQTGTTMTSFFNKNKIEYAMILKQTGYYTMTEIRSIVNIESESYFYKLLRKNTKV